MHECEIDFIVFNKNIVVIIVHNRIVMSVFVLIIMSIIDKMVKCVSQVQLYFMLPIGAVNVI